MRNKICLVVLNYNDYVTTESFIKNIENYKSIDTAIVIDNKSNNDSFDKLKKYNRNNIFVYQSDHNGGYNYGNKFGLNEMIRLGEYKYFIISNPDVIFEEDTIIKMYNTLENNDKIGLIAPIMINRDKTKNYKSVWKIPNALNYILFSFKYLGFFSRKFMYYSKNELIKPGIKIVDCVAGSFYMMRTDAYMDAKPFDTNLFLYCEETVSGIQLRKAGWKVAVDRDITFLHDHSTSIDKTFNKFSQRKIMWKSRIYVLEKYFNLNLFEKWIVSRIKNYYELKF